VRLSSHSGFAPPFRGRRAALRCTQIIHIALLALGRRMPLCDQHSIARGLRQAGDAAQKGGLGELHEIMLPRLTKRLHLCKIILIG